MPLNISYKAYANNNLKSIHQQIDTAGWIWNHCVALQRMYYKVYGGYININRLQKHIAKLRKRNEYWKQLNSQSVQEIVERLDMSYIRFFRKKSKRPPKFKKSKLFTSFVLKQVGWKLEDNILKIGKTKYKFTKHRPYENIKRIAVKRNKIGEIFFVLCCDMKPLHYKRVGESTIGMDFGLKTYLTLSNGTEIKSPEFFKNNLHRIRKLSKQVSSKSKVSKNRKKALLNLNREHIRLTNIRSDFEWKLAHDLCKHHSFIAIEDLNLVAMQKLWGRKISDLSFGSFVIKLNQVGLKYDTKIQKVGRFYPSSKKCGCGVVNKGLTLSDREWTCLSCGVTNQRDLHAANNILSEGIHLYRTKQKTSPLLEAV